MKERSAPGQQTARLRAIKPAFCFSRAGCILYESSRTLQVLQEIELATALHHPPAWMRYLTSSDAQQS